MATTSPGVQLAVGVLATGVAAGGLVFFESIGFPFGKPLTELSLAIVLLYFFPEPRPLARHKYLYFGLAALGVLLAICWLALEQWRGQAIRHVDVSSLPPVPLIAALVSMIFTAPLFEEKVVRHLLLDGLRSLGAVTACVLTSALFALAHAATWAWALAISLVLSVGTVRYGLRSVDRNCIHAAINATIVGWYLFAR
jgi:membrane protease YdiL (CAAX protease family)